MLKIDYLFEAFRKRAYIRKSFLLSIFSLIHDTPENKSKLSQIPYAAIRDNTTREIYFHDDQGIKHVLEDADFDKALFNKNEKITVDMNVHNFVKEKIETTIGLFLVNIVVLYEAVGDSAKYINTSITGVTIKGLIDSIMVDNPKDGGEIPEGKASVDQCLNISKQLDYLEGLNQVFVKASSTDVLTVHPEVLELRDKLLAQLEAEGKLGDPTAVSIAINEVVALDAKIQYSGPSKDFFINEKFIDNARKKMFVIFDMVPDFNTGKYKLLRNSLNEGWDKDHFPEYINTAISASYDRGAATGEGGYEVKVAILLTNRIEVAEEDCGGTRTELVTINKHNFKGWVGGFYTTNDGVKLITGDDKNLIGTKVNMRVPQFCQTKDDNLCRTCCGNKLGSIETRVSAETVFIFTQYMLTRMKGMHVSQLKTVTMDLDSILR